MTWLSKSFPKSLHVSYHKERSCDFPRYCKENNSISKYPCLCLTTREALGIKERLIYVNNQQTWAHVSQCRTNNPEHLFLQLIQYIQVKTGATDQNTTIQRALQCVILICCSYTLLGYIGLAIIALLHRTSEERSIIERTDS